MSCIYHKNDLDKIVYESKEFLVGYYGDENPSCYPSIFSKMKYQVTDDDTNEWIECEGLYRYETSLIPVGMLNLIDELIRNVK